MTSSFQREIRLAFQVSLFVAALVVLMIYLFLLNFFASLDDKVSIVLTRKYYPIVYGTLSFIGPFSILLFNKDLTKRMRLMLFNQRMVMSEPSSIVSSMKSNNRFATTRI
uniref:Serpentine receptor class gamma n=1 Tax=Caenorhabditis tropicalis TaxID=1561998 RepID=A0A1I7T466_9PELO